MRIFLPYIMVSQYQLSWCIATLTIIMQAMQKLTYTQNN